MTTMDNPPTKKKKGRPSLLDLQKRALLQQQQQDQTPNPRRLSTRRNPTPLGSSPPSNSLSDADADDERAKKKHKPLLAFNPNSAPTLSPFNSGPFGSDSNAGGEDPGAALKISTFHHGSNHMSQEEILKATDSSSILHGSQVESGPTTPLPDKKLLVFILDRLQKKDTRGVFSEPVDPEELPDYHEIIQNPMDFGTVRTKLDQGAYSSLEQFEKDVFLICSNAMEYNAPDTIYFRQARSIQELAKKDFENLRQVNEDGDPKPKIARRGRPPGKSMKKSIEGSPVDRVGPQIVSETTLASGGENSNLSGTYNLRRPAPHKFRSSDALNMAPHGYLSGETGASWLPGWENEFPASVLRSDLKYGKKHFTVDENRRDTYTQALASGDEPSIFSGCEGEWKQLVAVGLQFEHGYARSLARFAANLGPIAWKVASKKIGSVLPSGIKFGPGWIGENETSRLPQFSICEREQRVQSNPASDDHSDRLLPRNTLCSKSVVPNRFSLQSGVNVESRRQLSSHNEAASVDNGACGIRPVPPFPVQQNFTNHSGMSSSTDKSVPSQMLSKASESNAIIHQMPIKHIASEEAKLPEISSGSRSSHLLGGEASWHGSSLHNKQVSYSFPSDLNVKLGAPGSPQIGLQQQPDLALQL
ncbi:uncharacterized protein LOC103955527 [Pyrus x bretschneideri]|uniref:uncharacterized protein LOC103955527 n=1 Tax=Pyrus x bretschneideri TaxID=225117 RepID=UPI00202FEDF0|nr:uncharacterized protein LOC103955527 [Pyrus x bretschneideri]